MKPNPRYPYDVKAWFANAKEDFDWGKHDFKCQLIDKYYTQRRYPDFGPIGSYSKSQADEALKVAKKILDYVEKIIREK